MNPAAAYPNPAEAPPIYIHLRGLPGLVFCGERLVSGWRKDEHASMLSRSPSQLARISQLSTSVKMIGHLTHVCCDQATAQLKMHLFQDKDTLNELRRLST